MAGMKRTPAPGHGEWNWKPGHQTFRRWHGVALDGDPSSISPDQLRMAINVHSLGGDQKPRAGLTKVNTTAIGSTGACIEPWAYNIPPRTGPTAPYRLWVLGKGLPACVTTGGNFLGGYDQEQSPPFSRYAWYENTSNDLALGKYDGSLLIGADDTLRKVNVLVAAYGTDPVTTAGRATDPRLHKFTGFLIKQIRAFGTVALIGLSDGGSVGKVALWNGLTAYDGTAGTTADLTSINPPTAMAIWRERLVLGFASAYNRIMLRSPGSTTPGTYVTVTPGAGTVSAVDMCQGQDGNLYIASGGPDVWKYDGTTLASFRTIAGATITAVWWWNTFLYVGYNTASAARIARYDGTTWVDVHKDLTAQTGPPNLSNARTIKRLQPLRGKLLAVGNTATQGGRLWASPNLLTGGTWTEIIPSATNNGDLTWAEAA